MVQVLALFANHVVVRLVPRASKMLMDQQMFLAGGGGEPQARY